MKKRFLVYIGIVISVHLNAQTGIGTTTPDASAKLDVTSTNKGFLPPRIQLTATNSASPIVNPANGLMVFNTVTAGASPYQVVPGYYYWDAIGLKWVSLSTTVGNVQNQAIFRSTSNTSASTAISTWNSRFNNISAGDLNITSNTSFALSNGIYKIEWALPYEQSNTYNFMLLQEYSSSVLATFLNDNGYAGVGNGGGTDWGGGSFAADIVDCSSSTRTFRIINGDSYRTLYYGASFIITKLNPSITTSTTADNLGNHIATKNVQLNGYFLSNDGGNEGIRIDNSGNVGIGTSIPQVLLHLENGNVLGSGNPSSSTLPSIYVYNNNASSTTANALINVRTNGTNGGNPYYSLDVNGKYGYSMGLDNANSQFVINSTWDFNLAAATNKQIIMNRVGQSRVIIPSSGGSYTSDWPSGWGGSLNVYDISCSGLYYNVLVARSDRRLKNSIKDLDNDIFYKYLKLRPVTYYWNQDKPRDTKLQYGLIAQEVDSIFPEMVNTATDSMQTKSINYQALHAISLKAIQMLNEKIELQSREIDLLKQEFENLKRKEKKKGKHSK